MTGPIYSVIVQANGRTGPILADTDNVRVILSDEEGRLAEVQVAYARGRLVVIAAGEVLVDKDARGFARFVVAPE